MRAGAITCLALLAAAPAAEARPLDDLPERAKTCVPDSKLRVGGDESFRAVVAGSSGVVVRAKPEAGARGVSLTCHCPGGPRGRNISAHLQTSDNREEGLT